MALDRTARSLLALVVVSLAAPASGAPFPYQATLELRVSAGQGFEPTTVVDATFSGLADVDAGFVRIPPGALSVPVSGFGGQLVNGALTFAFGLGGPGATCPLSAIQERCIPGGGFGGLMALSGVTQFGQGLSAWGAGVVTTGLTTIVSPGLTRVVAGTGWTTGLGQAWFYVPEIDPTPFLHSASGSFIGLPTTLTSTLAASTPGFRVVTPVVVTGSQSSSIPNARGIAILTVRFVPRPVPLVIGGTLGAALGAIGYARLRERRAGSARRVDHLA